VPKQEYESRWREHQIERGPGLNSRARNHHARRPNGPRIAVPSSRRGHEMIPQFFAQRIGLALRQPLRRDPAARPGDKVHHNPEQRCEESVQRRSVSG